MDANPSQQHPKQEPGPALFFCHLCQSQYRQPKLLKCLHSFCMHCLKGIVIEDNDNRLVVCPLCSYATHLPTGGPEDLTDNTFLQRISSDYVTEVKSHIVARSLSPQTARKLGSHEAYMATSGTRRRFSEELAHLKMANLTDEQKTVTSRNLIYKADTNLVDAPVGFAEFRRSSVDRGEYSVSAMEAINNMSRLQGKLMSLQGEALKVTYAIDRINQHMTTWHQHKEDLKLEVQRRSHQFQIAAKKMERQILSQIESKAMEDQFYSQLDRGKSELRRNLKNILHEVSVLKSVHELGKYSEINDLSCSILRPSVGMTNVVLDMLSYQLDIPTKPIEEMISVGFGNLITTEEESRVYIPELKDFTNISLDEITMERQPDKDFDTKIEERTEVQDTERSRGRSTVSRRSLSTAGRSKRYTTDLGLSRSDVKEHLEQFQNARETFRTKRQEILRQGQHSREDLSPLRGEGRKLPWSNFRRGRVQSLDRTSNPDDRGRKAFKNLQTTIGQAGSSNTTDVQFWGEDNMDQEGENAGRRPEELGMPSPIIEEGVIPGSPKKGVTQDERIPERFLPQTHYPGDTASAEIVAPEESRQRTRSLLYSSRHSSLDETPPLSPNSESSSTGDFRSRANEGGRPLRKALSSAGDKRSKIEFLRENWQKRKELLIQSQGFVSSDTAGSVAKSPASSPGNLLPQRRFSDTRREDITNISRSVLANTSTLPTPIIAKTTSSITKQHESGRKSVQIAPIPTTMTVKPSFLSKGNIQQAASVQQVQEKHMSPENENEEQEVTSTITIPLSDKLLKDKGSGFSGVQNKQKGEDEEEEMTVTTETFTIGKDLITPNVNKESEQNPMLSSKQVSQAQTNLPNTQTSVMRSTPSYSIMHSSVRTTTLTSPTASTLHTSIITGTTLKAPSTVISRTSTISSPSTSTSFLPVSTTTTKTTMQSHSSVSARLEKAPTISSLPTTTTATTTTKTASSSHLAHTTTAPSTSQSASSTSSSYTGKYSRRYIPKTESIDVAALLANMYKPVSSSSQKDDGRKQDDEEKENIKNERGKQTENHTKEHKASDSITGNDRGVTKSALSSNYPSGSDRMSILDKKSAVDSTHMKSTDITVYKITDDPKTSQSLENTTVSPLSPRSFSYGQSQKDTTAIIKASNTKLEPPLHAQPGIDSEPTSLAPSSPRDQKVDETFNQAEASRKRVSPATSRSSARSSRRHTVEISKTIPVGMRLSDMYKSTSREPLRISEARVYGQPQSDLHRTVIEETQDEYIKDPTTSGARTLTIKIPDHISSTGSPKSNEKAQERVDQSVGGSRIPLGAFSALSAKQPDSGTTSPSSPMSVSSFTSYSSMASDSAIGQANANLARGKLRDIARKKKERWRRLTIS